MPSDTPESNQIVGTVESIVFHNEENGYTIMQVMRGGDPDKVTVLGNLPAVTEGEEIKAEGTWIDDSRFGRQFRAGRISAIAPKTRAGMTRFLASGLIDGIGKTYAKRIVEKFGTDTFHVIEHESQKLEAVQGIGAERRKKIKDSWKRQKSVRDIMIFLHAHGLSTARALRIFKNYGQEAVDILRKDPYRLAHDLAGVGFKTADEIARKMGQRDDSPQRLEAGLLFAMETAGKQGHCALKRDELISRATEILSTTKSLIETALSGLLDREDLLVDIIEKQELIFSPELHRAEVVVAKKISALAHQKSRLPRVDARRAFEWFERKTGFQLGEEQAAAVSGAMQSPCFVITGGPGVGKTTILNALLQILVAKKVDPVLCAPTGRASRRLSESTGHPSSTIHRLLEIQPDSGFSRNEQKPLEGDLFIVDEASMIDVNLMAGLVSAIPLGAHLVLVGDVDQLPSVGPGSVLRDLIDSETIPVARLSRIYRQTGNSRIITAAHDVNEGNLPPLDSAEGGDFFFFERENPAGTLDTLVKLVRERIPEGFSLNPRDDIQVLTPMNKNSLGTKAINESIQAILNPPAELKFEIERFGTTFRTGDKVIQLRNNYDYEVFNGDIGHIREISSEPVRIEVVFEGDHVVEYEPGELDELQLAYAITIHKSQGSEFPVVIIPLSTQHYVLLQRNLLYTGITRGKQLVILVGEKKALEMAVRNRDSSRRWTGLKFRLQSESRPTQGEDRNG